MKKYGPEIHDGEAFHTAALVVKHALEFSPALRQLSPLHPSDAERWVSYWKSEGYLTMQTYA
jgi:hypothetical protein